MENAKTQTKSHAMTISPEARAAINAAAAARWNKLAARANTELQTTTTPPQNGSEYAETPMKSPKPHDVVLDVVSVIETLREVVMKALVSTSRAVRDCLAAGQALNEARAAFSRRRGQGGEFAEWDDGNGWAEFVKKNLPEISDETARRWMKAAANVMRVVGDGQWQNSAGQVIDVEAISFSKILATADDELSADSREWKQTWMDFTERKTIKECLAGVFVEGDESSRSERAMNGLTARQTSGAERRDYPEFALRKLRHLSRFFGSWSTMTEHQRTEIKSEFVAAICGEEFKLRGRPGEEHFKAVEFEAWPVELCEVAMEALRARMKGSR